MILKAISLYSGAIGESEKVVTGCQCIRGNFGFKQRLEQCRWN